MKKITTTLYILIIITSQINAQIEQVSVGPGYSQQAYYNISSGEVDIVGK